MSGDKNDGMKDEYDFSNGKRGAVLKEGTTARVRTEQPPYDFTTVFKPGSNANKNLSFEIEKDSPISNDEVRFIKEGLKNILLESGKKFSEF